MTMKAEFDIYSSTSSSNHHDFDAIQLENTTPSSRLLPKFTQSDSQSTTPYHFQVSTENNSDEGRGEE